MRLLVVGLTFAYYALAAKLLSHEIAANLFLLITIVTAIELFIVGATESLILQHQYTKNAEKSLRTRQFLSVAGVVAASLYSIEYICLGAGLFNSIVRVRTAKARASNNSSAILLDGLPQSVLNIIIISLTARFIAGYAIFTPLLTALIVIPISALVIKPGHVVVTKKTESSKDHQASLAVYAQFMTSSVTSIALGFISGSLYRELFLAQRFGDSMINFSRVLQWTKVEKVRSGADVLDFTSREFIAVLGLAILCAISGLVYGVVTELRLVFFHYLPLFILTGVFTVLLANLTQCYIQADSTALLLKLRLTQLTTVAVGAALAGWMKAPLILVLAAAIAQISVYIYVKYQSLHRAI